VAAGEPVSWLVIEKGWAVETADGGEVAKVEEVIGDSELDIFNGLAVATGLLQRMRYVPAELGADIREGAVRLAIGADEVDRLDEYDGTPPSGETRPA
jgi:hypothetical protein